MLKPNNFFCRKNISLSLPYEQISNPEVDRVLNIINALRANAGNVNGGGCGYFAVMLQELIGGRIYHLTYMIRNGMQYELTLGHNILIKGEYCYDFRGVCRKISLFRNKKLKRSYRQTQFKYIPSREQYILFDNDRESIEGDYSNGDFFGDFSKRQLEQLRANFEAIKQNLALVNYQSDFHINSLESAA